MTPKAVLRGKFIAINVYIKLKISELGKKKKELTKSKANGRKEIIKITVEINGTQNRETIKKIRKNNS